jgi:hypothetical protein
MTAATDQPEIDAELPGDYRLAMDAHDVVTLAQELFGKLVVLLVAIEKESCDSSQAHGLARIASHLTVDLGDLLDIELGRLDAALDRRRKASEVPSLGKVIDRHRAANASAAPGSAQGASAADQVLANMQRVEELSALFASIEALAEGGKNGAHVMSLAASGKRAASRWIEELFESLFACKGEVPPDAV